MIQLSEQPDMVRMRTEHPDVLVDEAIIAVKEIYAKAGRDLTADQEKLLRDNSMKNLKYLRGER